jgi:hypothetical protein
MNKVLLASVLALTLTTPLLAQQAVSQCSPNREGAIRYLADQFQESRQSAGLAASGHLVEVFANTETGSWTITVTLPNGTICLLASGQSYEQLNESLEPNL